MLNKMLFSDLVRSVLTGDKASHSPFANACSFGNTCNVKVSSIFPILLQMRFSFCDAIDEHLCYKASRKLSF